MTKQYYVENKEAGFVGNCLLWWRKKGAGYGCDIEEAEVFNEDDLLLLELSQDPKYQVWDKVYIDALTTKHVDHQKLNCYMSGLKR